MRAVIPTTPHLPRGCTRILEEPARGLPALVHPEWTRRYPWLVQGTTARGDGEGAFDLGTFSGASGSGDVLGGWERLRRWAGARTVVHARQVHGSAVRFHAQEAPGIHIADPCDGHATRVPGLLLAVTVADCIPVTLLAPGVRAVAVLHAGWRGVAAGILERGLATLTERAGAGPGGVTAHLGPAICGTCYEVGPEVFEGLGLQAPPGPRPVDLRAVAALRLVAAGVPAEAVSVSGHCTRCGPGGLFSHRGGDGQRQAGFAALLP